MYINMYQCIISYKVVQTSLTILLVPENALVIMFLNISICVVNFALCPITGMRSLMSLADNKGRVSRSMLCSGKHTAELVTSSAQK